MVVDDAHVDARVKSVSKGWRTLLEKTVELKPEIDF
jgi:hypothetical protein